MKERISDDPIPRYAQLDIWMALGFDPTYYEASREMDGFAETWAQLCAEVPMVTAQARGN
jgi:hypothetical protein